MRLKFKPWQLVALKDVKCRSLWFAIVNHNFPSQNRNTQKPCFYPTDVQAECVCGVLLSGVLLLTVKWAGNKLMHFSYAPVSITDGSWSSVEHLKYLHKKTDQSDMKWQLSVGLTQSNSVKKRGKQAGPKTVLILIGWKVWHATLRRHKYRFQTIELVPTSEFQGFKWFCWVI